MSRTKRDRCGKIAASPVLHGVEALTFDLFDTIVTLDPVRLPSVDWGGDVVPSTAPLLWQAVRPLRPDLTPNAFLEELLRSATTVASDIHSAGLAEVPAERHFEPLVQRLGLDAQEVPQLLAAVHMRAIADAAGAVAGARELLHELRTRKTRAVLISNLDFPPAAAWILEQAGLSGFFDAIVLSGDVGLRKPHPRPFLQAIDLLGLEPGRVLHVGDHPIDDVWGAARLGMHTAWIRGGGAIHAAPGCRPDLNLANLTELRNLLGGPSMSGA